MTRLSLFSLLIAGCLLATPVLATEKAEKEGFGPSRWTQYRLNATNNAVFDNGATPLPRMTFRTGDQVRATPVVVGDALYIGNHATGGMFRFDLPDGKVAWDDDHPWFRHAPNWIHSDMIQADGRIFVGYGNRAFQSAEVRGTGESGVMAVNPENGETLWKHPTRGEVMPTPALWKDALYIVTGGGRLVALAPASGERLWSLDLPGWVSMSSPAIRDGVLYVGALNSVVAVDLERQEILWTFDEDATFTDVPPAVSEDGVVVITGMMNASLLDEAQKRRHASHRGYFHFIYALDAASGELLWSDLLGSGPHQDNNTSGAPTIAGDGVYVGSPYTWSFFAYDLESGERRWEYPVGAKIKGAPAIIDGKVVFGDTAGFLHLLDAEKGQVPVCDSGRPVGKLKVGGSTSNSQNAALAPGGPVVVNRTVFVGSQDRFVHAVPLKMLECRE
ncbi:Outer membrane protein assembly factor BamB, contains PQQ-like beta-propeller repeat [Modicisalibacter ilicicola DSM 19980]|uniref:Outer membrane protein assembly factor BamB, contains PQQ-like beta-propeller repeat n=1 Tax=Modicisalibacter ilicicola DSM 19980 TaxID=1121942 RepID=A0A1M4V8L0_9GAMM|nr:PQQ-binding-like beta-propeller repeat protein [Halomonas ilicicola]SHE65305.1 Outer membrane protein assembly factor BamB, contains PQQ-like beta-propeller repeat [Halomonas ilicicola DSM 19980]